MRQMGAVHELPPQPKPVPLPFSQQDISRGFDAVLKWCASDEARQITAEIKQAAGDGSQPANWERDNEWLKYAREAKIAGNPNLWAYARDKYNENCPDRRERLPKDGTSCRRIRQAVKRLLRKLGQDL
jgi:hypothetical protein